MLCTWEKGPPRPHITVVLHTVLSEKHSTYPSAHAGVNKLSGVITPAIPL